MNARTLTSIALIAVMSGLGGCASSVLAPKIVTAPNASGQPRSFLADRPEARVAVAQIQTTTFRVATGPPAAEIAVGVVEPGDYRHEHRFEFSPEGSNKAPYRVNTRWVAPPADAPRVTPRGTIVIVHGFWMTRETMVHWAIDLAEAGYRTVLVDLGLAPRRGRG